MPMSSGRRPPGICPSMRLHRMRRVVGAALAVSGLAIVGHDAVHGFVLASAGRATSSGPGGSNVQHRLVARKAGEYVELGSQGLAGFQGSELSLWTTLFIFVVSLPGVYSTIQRTGQAKFVEKIYVMPGTAAGGLEMRSIAGGIVAYFKGLNYTMEDAPRPGKIRFVGNLQGSISQALYLTGCLAGALISCGIVFQSLFPEGPFSLGVNFWYAPAVFSPYAGWYYWERAFRRDICELQLEMSDDMTQTTLSALGDRETIELLQKGVRFQSPEGKLFQLMEKGMEYQPGMFEDGESVVIWKEKGGEASQAVPAVKTGATA